ncbi:MAG: PAS domain S-box protein [Campylobacterales bacterium]
MSEEQLTPERRVALYEQLFDRLPINIFLKDESGRLLFVNRATLETVGLTKEQAIGRTDYEIFPEPVARLLREGDEAVFKEGGPLFREERIEHEGRVRWLYSGKTVIVCPEGDRRLLLGYSMDITDRKQIEEELVAQKALIEQVLDTDPNLIFVKDQNNRFTLVNQAVVNLFGLSKEAISGQNNATVHADETENRVFEQTDQAVLERGETVTLDESFTRPDGSVRWFRTIKRPVMMGSETQVLGISADITDQRAYEERLKKALHAEKQFIASMSHEIRTPLNSIMGYLDLLKTSALDENGRDFLRKADVSAQHLFSLINDILDISKIEAGQLDLSPAPLDLDELLLECGVIVSSRVNPKVTLNIEPPRLAFNLLGDAMRIKQIFVNLLGNAAKFTAQGFIRLKLERHELQAGGQIALEFVIEDTGIGIAREQQAEIFKPFRRAHGGRYEGTGLGLYLSRALAERMGGTIRVESQVGHGSRFTVTMTLQKGQTRSVQTRLEGFNLLLIGDDSALHLLMDEAERLGAGVRRLSPQRSGQALGAELERHLRSRTAPNLALVACDELEDRAVHILWLLRDLIPSTMLVAVGMAGGASEEADAVVAKPLFLSTLMRLLADQVKDRAKLMGDWSGSRILMVEDVEINAELAREMFKRFFNTDLQVARSGEEAIWRLKNEKFDLVFMDIQMPGCSGIEATRSIRLFNPAIPIVAISANAFAEDAAEAKAAGMDDYLTKPIRKERVAEVLSHFLSRRAKTEEPETMTLKARIRTYYEREHSKESAARLSELAASSLLSELGRLKALLHATVEPDALRQCLHRLKGILLNSGFLDLAKKVAEQERAMGESGLPEIDFLDRLLVALELEPDALEKES